MKQQRFYKVRASILNDPRAKAAQNPQLVLTDDDDKPLTPEQIAALPVSVEDYDAIHGGLTREQAGLPSEPAAPAPAVSAPAPTQQVQNLEPAPEPEPQPEAVAIAQPRGMSEQDDFDAGAAAATQLLRKPPETTSDYEAGKAAARSLLGTPAPAPKHEPPQAQPVVPKGIDSTGFAAGAAEAARLLGK